MSISLLPNEILVNIISRLDSDSIQSVSLLNKRFHSLVERHNLYKPIADTIKFTSVLKSGTHGISVTVCLPPKNNKKREKRLYINLDGENDENVNKKITDFLSQIRLAGTKAIDATRLRKPHVDIFKILDQSGISLEYLETCRSYQILPAAAVNKDFLDKLIAREPENICFRNCITSLSFEDVYEYMKKHFQTMPRHSVWQFGVYTMTDEQLNKVLQFMNKIQGRPGRGEIRYAASEEGQGMWNININNEDRYVYFMWQNKDV